MTKKEFEELLSEWYDFFRYINNSISNLMKTGQLGPSRALFFLNLEFMDAIPKISKVEQNLLDPEVSGSKVKLLIDDSSKIQSIGNWLTK